MCYHTSQRHSVPEIEERFHAEFENQEYEPVVHVNGFNYPETPVITNTDRDSIQLFNWGLVPHWAKKDFKRSNTLNARCETLSEKPSFRNSVNNRCLVIADGIYDWQDVKGSKDKQCYFITQPQNQLFAFAGLYSSWIHPETNKKLFTYTIVTTVANPTFQEIHNHIDDDRMLLMLKPEQEKLWLDGINFEHSMDIPLVATPIPSILKKK